MKISAGISAALVFVLGGCMDLGRDRTAYQNKAVVMPEASEPSIAIAARVDQVGRAIVAQNPFLGIDPVFHTVGRKEPEIFHPDDISVYVSEGLVERCKTDSDLAAVLAVELGKMIAQHRVASRMQTPDPAPFVSGGMTPGGPDQTQLGVQAVFDQQLKTGNTKTPLEDDPKTLARNILKSAGYDEKLLEGAAPILDDASHNHGIADQFIKRGDKPRWSF